MGAQATVDACICGAARAFVLRPVVSSRRIGRRLPGSLARWFVASLLYRNHLLQHSPLLPRCRTQPRTPRTHAYLGAPHGGRGAGHGDGSDMPAFSRIRDSPAGSRAKRGDRDRRRDSDRRRIDESLDSRAPQPSNRRDREPLACLPRCRKEPARIANFRRRPVRRTRARFVDGGHSVYDEYGRAGRWHRDKDGWLHRVVPACDPSLGRSLEATRQSEVLADREFSMRALFSVDGDRRNFFPRIPCTSNRNDWTGPRRNARISALDQSRHHRLG